MARLAFRVQADGLIVDTIVWLDGGTADDLTARGLPVPTPIHCRGLLDTGSDVTAVSASIPARLGLVPTRRATTTTAAGPTHVDLYTVSLSVTDAATPGAPMLSAPNLLVTQLAAPLPGVEVLIGLDVLLSACLLLDGPGRTFTLDF
jgi:hypothetical protein